MKSFRLIPAIVAAAMLVGCVPSNKKETELTQETQQEKRKQRLFQAYRLMIHTIERLRLINKVLAED